jgi:hypothetical protein
MTTIMNARLDASFPSSDEGTGDAGQKSLREKEASAREESKHSTLFLFIINGYAAFLVFLFHLISLETVFSIILCIVLTIVTYYQTEDNLSWNGGIMNWTLLSFAIVTPMAASLGMAFTRRESALQYLASIRATLLELYGAHAVWDWSLSGKDNSGRIGSSVDWQDHSDKVLTEIIAIGYELERALTLPSASRARHRMTGFGRNEACELSEVSRQLSNSLALRMGRLTIYAEILKHEGLPGNEASRMRQWERETVERLEFLRNIKTYRTPQALRSLCRIFSVFLPPFYAPYYAQMAREMNSLGIAISFSILTSLALTALFESVSQMEDPFVGHLTLDGIDCHNELRVIYNEQLLIMRSLYYPHAPPFETKVDVMDRKPTDNGRDHGKPRIFNDGQ